LSAASDYLEQHATQVGKNLEAEHGRRMENSWKRFDATLERNFDQMAERNIKQFDQLTVIFEQKISTVVKHTVQQLENTSRKFAEAHVKDASAGLQGE
jgi:hypothetical protein